jgi:hypothetical protein
MRVRWLALAALTALAVSALAGAQHERARVVFNRNGLAARNNANLGIPPDPSGAIGRRYYLEAVNVRLALYDARSLRLLTSRDAYAFWHRSNTSQLVDPYVAWDDRARRFYVVMSFNGTGDNNQLLVAWSKRGRRLNLSGSWCRMSIRVGKYFEDYPKLGFSRTHILIGTNIGDLSTRELLGSRIWALGIPQGNSCSRLPVTSFGSETKPLRRADGRLAFTPVPVVPVHPSRRGEVVAADCVYEVPGEEPPTCGLHERKANQITVWHVEGGRGSPRLVRDGGIDVPVFRLPSPAPQPGSAKTLDTSDTRLYQAVSAPDPTRHLPVAVWTQHAVAGPGGRSQIRWYELDPRRLRLVRRGTVASRRNWIFSGAISPTRTGRSEVLHYVVSGHRLLPQLRAKVFLGGRPRADTTLARSSFAVKCDAKKGEPCNWGDYAEATPDPTHPSLIWGSNELVGSPKHRDKYGLYWRTRNFAFRVR